MTSSLVRDVILQTNFKYQQNKQSQLLGRRIATGTSMYSLTLKTSMPSVATTRRFLTVKKVYKTIYFLKAYNYKKKRFLMVFP